jgi:hypothetical protein
MSDQITKSFIKEFKAGIEVLYQQMGSRLRGAVRVETQHGKNSFYDQINATAVRRRTVRHGDSPYIPTPHSRRMNVLNDFDWGDYIDDMDKLRTLNDPANEYVQAASYALGREMDQAILVAAFADANTGEEGEVPLDFAADGGTTVASSIGTTTDMNILKLLTAKEALDDNEAGDDRYCAITARQLRDLLETTEVTSSDYNQVKALVHGEVDTFLGFNFIRVSAQLTAVNGSSERLVPCWDKNALLLGIGKDIEGEIARRSDKSFSWYAYACASFASTRMQGKGVVKIECAEP